MIVMLKNFMNVLLVRIIIFLQHQSVFAVRLRSPFLLSRCKHNNFVLRELIVERQL